MSYSLKKRKQTWFAVRYIAIASKLYLSWGRLHAPKKYRVNRKDVGTKHNHFCVKRFNTTARGNRTSQRVAKACASTKKYASIIFFPAQVFFHFKFGKNRRRCTCCAHTVCDCFRSEVAFHEIVFLACVLILTMVWCLNFIFNFHFRSFFNRRSFSVVFVTQNLSSLLMFAGTLFTRHSESSIILLEATSHQIEAHRIVMKQKDCNVCDSEWRHKTIQHNNTKIGQYWASYACRVPFPPVQYEPECVRKNMQVISAHDYRPRTHSQLATTATTNRQVVFRIQGT